MQEFKPALNAQKAHWERMLAERREMFGEAPSEAARKAAETFMREGIRNVLELGAGQGRDTLFFARGGFSVVALDYAASGLRSIRQKSQSLSLSVDVLCHDVRNALPFRDESLDACYSHMLYCMALTLQQLEALSAEVRRVLRPGGLEIYTVRNTADADHGKGLHLGEDLYEVGGFVVQFFDRNKVLYLARDWELLAMDQLTEGKLPRQLFFVMQKKPLRKHAQ
jgi:SAM-dependent methyltransferase